MLRMVDALQFHEEHGDVCPAQWEKGQEGMNASPKGVADFLKRTPVNCKFRQLRDTKPACGLVFVLNHGQKYPAHDRVFL